MLSRSALSIIIFVAALFLLFAGQGWAATSVDCFSCHEKDGFKKRVTHEPVSEGDCFTCHSPHVAKFAGLLQDEIKDLCYSCHSDLAGEHTQGFVHLPVKRGECIACHDPHASNQDGLLNDRPSEVCFSCHEELPKKFKHTHLPYAKGQCSACHQSHQSAQPYLLNKEADLLCFDCHKLTTLQSKHRNFPDELKNCGSCHNPHGSDRRAMVRNFLHQPYTDDCSNCHTGKGVPVPIDVCFDCHSEVIDQMSSSHNHLVRYEDNGCIACHSPHAGDEKRLLKGNYRHVCSNCHEATFERHDLSNFSHPETDACNDCHAPHGSNHPSMLRAPINEVCNDCHGLHGAFTHPIGEEILDPRTGQMLTCVSCHAVKGTDFEYFTRSYRKKALCVQCHNEY